VENQLFARHIIDVCAGEQRLVDEGAEL